MRFIELDPSLPLWVILPRSAMSLACSTAAARSFELTSSGGSFALARRRLWALTTSSQADPASNRLVFLSIGSACAVLAYDAAPFHVGTQVQPTELVAKNH